MKKGYLYILKSEKTGKYYVGSTIDINRRLNEHQSGQTKSLKNQLPIKSVFNQEFENISYARRIEYKLKKLKSRKIIEKIIEDGEVKMDS